MKYTVLFVVKLYDQQINGVFSAEQEIKEISEYFQENIKFEVIEQRNLRRFKINLSPSNY